MAKLIGIHRNTLSLVFLAIVIFGGAVQGLTQVCDRPSRNHVGGCSDHKTCRDACMAEPDGRIFAGVCQTTTSVTTVSQSDFTACVNHASNLYGLANTNSPDCFVDMQGLFLSCEEVLKKIQEDCRIGKTVNSGDRCTCSYMC